jgi:hypothetical protein
MLSDVNTLSLSLTYVGTLLVALLMFLGQLTAMGVLLVLAGIARLLALPAQIMGRATENP